MGSCEVMTPLYNEELIMDRFLAALRDESLWDTRNGLLTLRVNALSSILHSLPEDMQEEARRIALSRVKARPGASLVVVLHEQNTHRPYVNTFRARDFGGLAMCNILRAMESEENFLASCSETFKPRARIGVSCYYETPTGFQVRDEHVNFSAVLADSRVMDAFCNIADAKDTWTALRRWNGQTLLYGVYGFNHKFRKSIPEVFNPYFAEKWGVTIEK